MSKQDLIDELEKECWQPYRERKKDNRSVYMTDIIYVINKHLEGKVILPVTPEKGEPMPKTIEQYMCNAIRDQELILEQKDEIAKMSQTINKLRQKMESRK